MKITNVEIAKIVEEKGYDYQKALDGIDAGRTQEQEKEEISKEELEDMIENICLSFKIDGEYKRGEMY